MSSCDVASIVIDITNKWELAQRISVHTKIPEQALQSIFQAAMQQLEVLAHTKFESSMKERVWVAISGQRLKDIRDTFMLEFCDQILGSFSEEEVVEMLEEHIRTGAVNNITYSTQIQTAYALCQSSIIAAVVKKASSMSNGLVPDLVVAVKREGIKLPEPKISHFKVLTDAVETGDLDKAREALQNGANANGSVGVKNIIHIACEKGNVGIVRELLDSGAELNSRDSKWNDTPLHRACVFGHTAVVEELIKRGAMVNVRNRNCWQTPLENAITFKHFECCKLLVEAGAQVNEVNHSCGSTPLMEACYTGCYEIIKLLLDAGANPNLRPEFGMTALYQAVHSPAILQLMLDRGAKVNTQNGPGLHYQANQYPLHAAASCGYHDSVNVLLKAGADPKVEDGKGKTPIELAQWHLNNHRTDPCNPPDVTANIIERLEKVIGLLQAWTR